MPDDSKKETNKQEAKEVNHDELNEIAGGLMGPPDTTPKKCSGAGCHLDAVYGDLCSYHYMVKMQG